MKRFLMLFAALGLAFAVSACHVGGNAPANDPQGTNNN